MTREIKFRAFEKAGNQEDMCMTDSEYQEYLKERSFIYSTENNAKRAFGFMFDFGYSGCSNEDFYISQYTGLKDKNGKEIYEGDIIKYSSQRWDAKTKVFVSPLINKEVVTDMVEWLQDYGYSTEELGMYKEIEVIGNIYENKELLK